MPTSKLSLIVQPGDSFFPIVEAIDSARSSINLTIFRMDDPVIQQSLSEAAARGVRVRALIATSPRGWVKENKRLLKELRKSGVTTKQPEGDSPKTRYHYKVLTVDDSVSLVLTFNPTRENLHYTRDYGVRIEDEAIAGELNRLFDADWVDADFAPDEALPLAISPYNTRSKMLEFFASATRSIHISDKKLQDHEVISLLEEKARAGVLVRALGSESVATGRLSPIEHRAITRFKMHAKCSIVDSERAFVGSMNMRPTSLDRRREVGVFVHDPHLVKQLEHVFDSDWNQRSMSRSTMKTTGAVTLAGGLPPAAEAVSDYALLSRTDALSRFPLSEGENRIGRASDNDIVIAHPSVSRAHAVVVLNGTQHYIVDLNSQNGTYLNGVQIAGEAPVKVGDIIGIAQSDEFRFIEV